jgi:hypothetical protein
VYALAYRYVYTILHLGYTSAILFSYEMLLLRFYGGSFTTQVTITKGMLAGIYVR